MALELVHAKQLMIANEQQDSVSLSLSLCVCVCVCATKRERGARRVCRPSHARAASFWRDFFFFLIFLGCQNLQQRNVACISFKISLLKKKKRRDVDGEEEEAENARG